MQLMLWTRDLLLEKTKNDHAERRANNNSRNSSAGLDSWLKIIGVSLATFLIIEIKKIVSNRLNSKQKIVSHN